MSFGSGRWGPLSPVLALVGLIGVLFVAGAWFQMYLSLSCALIPQLYGDNCAPRPRLMRALVGPPRQPMF